MSQAKGASGSIEQLMVGDLGGELVSTTAAKTGNYGVIYPLEDTTFTLVTSNIAGTWTGITFKAGIPIFGQFSAVTLATGKVILYNR